METSPRLGLSYVMAAQAQKHITVNESFQQLDALTQMSVRSASTDQEPASPASGDAYILPPASSGTNWDQMTAGSIAVYQENFWREFAPLPGFRAYAQDTASMLVFNGADWTGSGFVFTEGGAGVTSIFRNDIDRVQNPRTDSITAVSSDIITLPATNAAQYFFDEPRMAGVSFLRIWNTSKSPIESAWVKAVPDWSGDRKQLQVTDAADIAGWSTGETVQVGDPTSETPGRVMALDVSPMLQKVFGAVFPQKGLYCKGSLAGNTLGDLAELSPSGEAGTFIKLSGVPATGVIAAGNMLITTNVPSPISNSNLLMVREAIATTAGITLFSALGVII